VVSKQSAEREEPKVVTQGRAARLEEVFLAAARRDPGATKRELTSY